MQCELHPRHQNKNIKPKTNPSPRLWTIRPLRNLPGQNVRVDLGLCNTEVTMEGKPLESKKNRNKSCCRT